jgi:hypothetical protein
MKRKMQRTAELRRGTMRRVKRSAALQKINRSAQGVIRCAGGDSPNNSRLAAYLFTVCAQWQMPNPTSFNGSLTAT